MAACSVGPRDLDAHIALPAATVPAPITPESAPGQVFSPATASPAAWWTAFASPQLDLLVTEALRHNNDIATADASLRQAAEQARAAGGALLPQADETEILALVEPVAKRDAPAPVKAMASFLQAQALERRRLRESAASARATLRDERRALETQKQRADALQERATALAEDPDVAQNWLNALTAGLAAMLAEKYAADQIAEKAQLAGAALEMARQGSRDRSDLVIRPGRGR